jgi:hypothetical protein
MLHCLDAWIWQTHKYALVHCRWTTTPFRCSCCHGGPLKTTQKQRRQQQQQQQQQQLGQTQMLLCLVPSSPCLPGTIQLLQLQGPEAAVQAAEANRTGARVTLLLPMQC